MVLNRFAFVILLIGIVAGITACEKDKSDIFSGSETETDSAATGEILTKVIVAPTKEEETIYKLIHPGIDQPLKDVTQITVEEFTQGQSSLFMYWYNHTEEQQKRIANVFSKVALWTGVYPIGYKQFTMQDSSKFVISGEFIVPLKDDWSEKNTDADTLRMLAENYMRDDRGQRLQFVENPKMMNELQNRKVDPLATDSNIAAPGIVFDGYRTDMSYIYADGECYIKLNDLAKMPHVKVYDLESDTFGFRLRCENIGVMQSDLFSGTCITTKIGDGYVLGINEYQQQYAGYETNTVTCEGLIRSQDDEVLVNIEFINHVFGWWAYLDPSSVLYIISDSKDVPILLNSEHPQPTYESDSKELQELSAAEFGEDYANKKISPESADSLRVNENFLDDVQKQHKQEAAREFLNALGDNAEEAFGGLEYGVGEDGDILVGPDLESTGLLAESSELNSN